MALDKERIKADYFTFDGALSQSEFQRSFIILFIIGLVLNSLTYHILYPTSLFGVIIFIARVILWFAFVSITIRRLRDINYNPLLALLWLVPPLGLLLDLYLLIAERKSIL